MIIGAFAATVYGIMCVTYDIDIVVDLDERQIEALAADCPLPRYYVDPVHMRDLIHMGVMSLGMSSLDMSQPNDS